MGVLDKIKGKLGHKGHKKSKSRSRRDLSHKNTKLKGGSRRQAGTSSSQGRSGRSHKQRASSPDPSNTPPSQLQRNKGVSGLSGGDRAGTSPSGNRGRRPSRKGSMKNPGDLQIPEAPQPNSPDSQSTANATNSRNRPRSRSGRSSSRGSNTRSNLNQGLSQGGRQTSSGNPPPRQRAGGAPADDQVKDQLEEIISQNETMIDLLKRIRQSLRSRER